MGESNTVVSACTMYRHLQQYCSYPSICIYLSASVLNLDESEIKHIKNIRHQQIPLNRTEIYIF